MAGEGGRDGQGRKEGEKGGREGGGGRYEVRERRRIR